MRSLVKTFIIIALVVCASNSVLLAQGTAITLLHVNDSHSHLDAVGPKDVNLDGSLGGIAKIATIVGMTRAAEANVLLLHAGDVFQGDPIFNTYFGIPELQMMLQLGFDAMTVGNHEFDFGPDVTAWVLSTAFAGGSFPVLSANLDMSAYPVLQTWIRPSIVKDVAGVKIGIFGMTVPNNPTSNPKPVIVREDIVPVATQAVAELRAAGADVVICLSHLGLFLDQILASQVGGIDFIIGGHDHYALAAPIAVPNPRGQTLIFQAGEHYKYIGKLSFVVENGHASVKQYSLLSVDEMVPQEETLQAVVESLKEGVKEKFGDLYQTTVGRAATDLEKLFDQASPWRDTPLGNLVTDAFRKKTGTEIAITPIGLISEKLYAGAIVGADVFRSMSYGFDEATGYGLGLAMGRISGADLLKGLEIGVSQLEVTTDFMLQVSGIEFNYHPQRPVGHRITHGSIRINGKPFVPVKSYTITVNTGVLMLLGMFGITLQDVQVLPDFEYAVVRDYISELGIVGYGVEGRIRDLSVVIPPQSIVASDTQRDRSRGLQLHRNYPNPFNPSTVIEYEVPRPSHVSLKVYDMLGREVATLVDGVQAAGTKMATFNAGGLPSGVYIYRLTGEGMSETRRMILMK